MRRLRLAVAVLSTIAFVSCQDNGLRSPTEPGSPSPAEPTAPSLPDQSNIAGTWAGSYSPEPIECGNDAGPAEATFTQNDTSVSGTLSAAPPDCWFSNRAMSGTLVGNRLQGTAQIFPGAVVDGTLVGTVLSIEVFNSFGYRQGSFTLQRSG